MDKGFEGLHRMMRKHCPSDMPVIVIALTDGHHTGAKGRLIRATEAMKQDSADIWAIGIGGSPDGVDEALLQQVVSKPGQCIFIGNWDGPESIIKTFGNIVGLYFLDGDEEWE